MRKVLIFALTIFLFSVVLSSCKTRHAKCPAYKSEVITNSPGDKA